MPVTEVPQVEIRPGLRLARPVDEVRAVFFDPRSAFRWLGVAELKVVVDHGTGVGTVVEVGSVFVGRTFRYRYEITATDGTTFQERTVRRPFPMVQTYRVEPDGDGTWVSVHVVAASSGYFGLADAAARLLGRTVLQRALERLRTVLESGG